MKTWNLRFALVACLAGLVIIHATGFWNAREMVRKGYPDFTSFYAAGETVRRGHGHLLYDASEQWNTQQEFAQRVRIRQNPLPYLRLPFEALLFVPLTLFPYTLAYALWDALNVCVLVSSVLLLRRQIPFLQRYPKWLPVLIALAFTPVSLALLQGQDSILLVLVYALAYTATRQGAEFRAGCCLGLGLFKPHLVLPFVVIALLQRKRMLALGFLSVCVVLLLVSLGVAGQSALLGYPGYIWQLEGHTGRGSILPRDTPNLRGLVEGAFFEWVPSWQTNLVVGLLSIGLMVWATRRPPVVENRMDRYRVTDLLFCEAIIATFLLSYHAFAYDLGLLLVPVFILASEVATQGSRPTGFTRFALVAPMVFLLFGAIDVLLWFGFHAVNLVAIVLLLWMWGVARTISSTPPRLPT
jgi:Glycosyltransferase family 87